MMLIFQTENSTSWDSNTTYILVLNRGDSISTSSSYNPFISISGSYSESFIEWYEQLGFNKDQVSIFTKRYQMSIEFPGQKERIIN
jgi:hypothetical protein